MDTQTPVALVRRHAGAVPRYTSYPPAPQFTPRVGELQYIGWLDSLSEGTRLSLYVHIPFCHELCWYCGCNTKAARRYAPVAHYVQHLQTEIANVAALAPRGHAVTHLHWGGGSPNILTVQDIAALAEALRSGFRVGDDTEFAVEIDPRHLQPDQIDAFCSAGVTRVSVGVQDFDEAVQAAIGRRQSFAATRAAIDAFRERGVRSINIDLMYGLPHQTQETIDRTLERILALAPDRIAAFGYAHLPARLKHQRLIEEAALPDVVGRYAQSTRIARRLEEAGYVRIGLDHFARPSDALATGRLHRNFQGYTTDDAPVLVGMGASAIGRFPQGYIQNATAAGDYIRRIRDYGLAAARGIALTAEDRVRAYVIERLMCSGVFSGSDIQDRFGADAGPVVAEARALIASDRDGLLHATPDGFTLTERGRPFVRTICACFDAYLTDPGTRYSPGV